MDQKSKEAIKNVMKKFSESGVLQIAPVIVMQSMAMLAVRSSLAAAKSQKNYADRIIIAPIDMTCFEYKALRRYKTNNWLRRNGLPMRRKGR